MFQDRPTRAIISSLTVEHQEHWSNLNINYEMLCEEYCQTYNISHTLSGSKIVDHSDVVGASPVCAVPTTSSFLAATKQLYKWYFPSVRLSVHPSVCPSVCHTFLPLSPNWARGVLSSPAGRAGGRALPHTVTALPGPVLIGSWSNLVGTNLGAGYRTSLFMGDVAH